MAGDCHVVAGYGVGRTTWKFYWTPPMGTALTDATFFWGSVDGDCKMNSLKDDVKERKLTVRRVVRGAWCEPAGHAEASVGGAAGCFSGRRRGPHSGSRKSARSASSRSRLRRSRSSASLGRYCW